MNDPRIDAIKGWLGTGSINLFGRPFAGKDTQGEKLADMLGGKLVGGGDILRHYPDQATLKKLLSTGELIPTDMYLKIVLPYLSRNDLAVYPFILSSVGRMDGEQEAIMQATRETNHPIKAVVNLELNEDEVRRRFDAAQKLADRGERDDDSLDALEVRLKEFREKTVPVVDYYNKVGLLISVDGTGSREAITEHILETLYKKANES